MKRKQTEQRERNKRKTAAQKHRKSVLGAAKARMATEQGGNEENEVELLGADGSGDEEQPAQTRRRTRASRT